ncbi:hypothetical protein GDO86_016079 [Hymenochirus boettgeri]|uniref:Protein amnionless n=1 Tax=Hymenochirus boettgeri TaxID=247094 RepID=A0A8T2JVJ2_9PIPI|nr:hypothetical protein GDO86_016079 [Hymenochirus boettgeri]
MFGNDNKLSVYVQSSHSLKDMYLPWDGEFILSPSAGFSASPDDDAECGKGSSATFRNMDQYTWLSPSLWLSFLSIDDLERGKSLFHVDAESVPCQYDDIIFPPETSFRVNINTDSIQLRSISVMGRRFNREEDFSLYRQSNTGKLQFYGPGQLQITNTKCGDKTGCECGNERVLREICSSVLRHLENKCPDNACMNPLKPIGHCCNICGAIVSLEYTSEFDLESYRNRLTHTFLSLAKYSGVKMAISKVQRPESIFRIIPRGSIPEIQIVLIDNKNGSQTGSVAQEMAYDIMSDIQNHGKSFGIIRGNVILATATNTHRAPIPVGTILGTVIGILLCVSLIGAIIFLNRIGVLRLPPFGAFLFKRMEDESGEEISNMANKSFENPMFDGTTQSAPDAPALYTGEEALKGIVIRQAGVQFTNPLYDNSLSDV